MFSRGEIMFWVFALIMGLFLAYSCRLEAGEWNDKPIMCGNETETFDAIKAKKEELIFTAVQLTKVRSIQGLAKKPVGVEIRMFVNAGTGTYTIIEWHPPPYKTFCVISFGQRFQIFVGGVQ